ncbi:MAG: hypothetical protein INR69_05925 [Mucilaginibacter polytrichastri]|nr:hypothetical protein [Mucilaginibacter polytrichastri]
MKFFRAIAMLFSLLFFAGCGKEEQNNVPVVTVQFQAPVNDFRLSALNVPGNGVMISGYGVAGLVIYRSQNGNYLAYDRCSSYQPEKRCSVEFEEGITFQVIDPCSGSKFSLEDGSPVKAPASRSLKPYNCYVRNSVIFVVN